MEANNPFTEQVRLMVSLLPSVAKQACFALKGGTAINLFLRDMPRLSVDIDLAYLPVKDRAQSLNRALGSDIHILQGGILWTLNGLTYEDAWEFVKGATGVGPSQPFDFSNTSIKSPLFAAKKQADFRFFSNDMEPLAWPDPKADRVRAWLTACLSSFMKNGCMQRGSLVFNKSFRPTAFLCKKGHHWFCFPCKKPGHGCKRKKAPYIMKLNPSNHRGVFCFAKVLKPSKCR